MKTIGIIALVVAVFAFYRGFSGPRCPRQGYSYPQIAGPVVQPAYYPQPGNSAMAPIVKPAYYPQQSRAFGGHFNVEIGSW